MLSLLESGSIRYQNVVDKPVGIFSLAQKGKEE